MSFGDCKLTVSNHKWYRDRGEDEFGREGTYLKVMGKHYILVCNNGKPQRNKLHAPVCTLPEKPINQGQEGMTNFYSMLAEYFKESGRVHARPSVATPKQREEWTHQSRGTMVTDTDDSNL